MSFLVDLVEKQRALVYLVVQSTTRAIYFSLKRSPMPARQPSVWLASFQASRFVGPVHVSWAGKSRESQFVASLSNPIGIIERLR